MSQKLESEKNNVGVRAWSRNKRGQQGEKEHSLNQRKRLFGDVRQKE